MHSTRTFHRLLILPFMCALAEVLPRSHHTHDASKHANYHNRETLYSKSANEASEGWTISDRDLNVLRMLFKALDVEGTVLAPILKHKSAEDHLGLLDLHADELIDIVEDSDHLKNNLRNSLLKHNSKNIPQKQTRQTNAGSSQGNNRNHEVDREEYGNQTKGYEGCRRDYASLVEPLTDIILYGMHNDMCKENPEFCEENGEPNPPYRELQPWASSMFDALGKIPAAATDGNIHWHGSFEMCEDVHAKYEYYNHTYMEPGVFLEDREFRGRYCRVTLRRVSSIVPTPVKGLHIGICIPDTCDKDDVYKYAMEENPVLRSLLEDGLRSNITHLWVGYDLNRSTDTGYQFIIYLCVAILCVGIIAAIYDKLLRKRLLAKYTSFVRISLGSYTGKSNAGEDLYKQDIKGKEEVLDGTTLPEPNEKQKAPYRKFSSLSTISEQSGSSLPTMTRQTSVSGVPLFGTSPSVYDLEFVKPTWIDRMELVFLGFSFYSNTARIFSTKTKKDRLDVIDGIRFFSYCWMVLGHTWIIGPVYSDMWLSMNLIRKALTLPREFTFQHILNYHFHSETFFVISGTLVSYWWLKHFTAGGRKLSRKFIAYYFLHRWWSLMPVCMLSMVFVMNVYRYVLPHGVFVADGTPDVDNCRENWWRHFLLIHNLFREKQCMTWSLYFGVLWQLHCVSVLVLIPLVLKPIVGYIVLLCLWLIHVGSAAGVTSNIYTHGGFVRHFLDWYFDYFQTPWCRAGPYLVGLALGIVLFKTKCKFSMHWAINLCGWLLSFTVLFTVVYSTYDQYKEGGEIWSSSALVAYDTLARSAWGLAIAWIIFACSTGHGGIVTMFLSLKIYQPLCRLTLPAFFFHGPVIILYMYARFTPFYIDIRGINYTFLANFVIGFLCGFVVAIFFHYPISIGLERALLCKNKLQAIMSGCHPGDDLLRYAEDNYFGDEYQPWSLGGQSGSVQSATDKTGPTMAGTENGETGPGRFEQDGCSDTSKSEAVGDDEFKDGVRRISTTEL